jgi:hypothetical protein
MKPHQIQFTSYLIRAGLADRSGQLRPDLLKAALEEVDRMEARDRPQATPLQQAVINRLSRGPAPVASVDGRIVRSLINKGAAEVYETADLEEVRRAYGNPSLAEVRGPVSLIRLVQP